MAEKDGITNYELSRSIFVRPLIIITGRVKKLVSALIDGTKNCFHLFPLCSTEGGWIMIFNPGHILLGDARDPHTPTKGL
jgi:hypothetical protein